MTKKELLKALRKYPDDTVIMLWKWTEERGSVYKKLWIPPCQTNPKVFEISSIGQEIKENV
jgi:hypothetical protein